MWTLARQTCDCARTADSTLIPSSELSVRTSKLLDLLLLLSFRSSANEVDTTALVTLSCRLIMQR